MEITIGTDTPENFIKNKLAITVTVWRGVYKKGYRMVLPSPKTPIGVKIFLGKLTLYIWYIRVREALGI
ncbi:hypothetical protein [Dyadobacter chenwenxiniae]|uniref:hypothetical protein n=1 Tax=Dyadobacter chenwenxiniae TaxID=2906456 RepID=UPI001F2741F2|nr:hypothetical protein [Dyadobacter chenwenxiniae]